ncbi:MAG: hypothetical protein KatS3mg118_2731 [Paracoccaceae bacterium]|nr:MAG: hypothetical protein KatS3mg118_2731 [Paracoccaceae bacterium]
MKFAGSGWVSRPGLAAAQATKSAMRRGGSGRRAASWMNTKRASRQGLSSPSTGTVKSTVAGAPGDRSR